MNYIYTLHGTVVHIEPYTPFYQICTFMGPGVAYYFVKDRVPEIDTSREYYLTYSLKEGFNVHYEPLTDEKRAALLELNKKLIVHKYWLNFSNSVKLRYIKTGYGQDVLDRMMQEELNSNGPFILFQQLAESKGTTVDQEKETYKLYLQDVKFIFQFLISVEQKMLAFVKEGLYNEAYDCIQEAKLNLWIS